MRHTRSINSTNPTQPVPGYNTLAANLMASAWNSSTELHTVTTLGAAKLVAQKWAQNLHLCIEILQTFSQRGRKKQDSCHQIYFLDYYLLI